MRAVNPVGDSFLINAACHLALVPSSSSSDIYVCFMLHLYLGLMLACAIMTF